MAYLDRQRAEKLMSEANLDALILLSPESFYYATGAMAGVATMWRRAGAVAALVPANAADAEMAVASDLFAANFRRSSHISDLRESTIWVETTQLGSIDTTAPAADQIADAWARANRKPGLARPTTFDPLSCYQHLADALAERGLAGCRVGFEGTAISITDYALFADTLRTVQLIDATDVINRLKMVKSNDEIHNLRQAVNIAEHGIQAVHNAIDAGISRDELAAQWQQAIEQHPDSASLSGSWEYISVGPDPWGGNARVAAGDLIKVDVGCLVDGYTSDSARTFVFGAANKLQTQLYDALMAGFTAGSALLHPGVALADVHRTTLQAIRANGFTGYTRGHFGHGLGASVGSEQWPFISADATVELEAGMVVAFECPWYIDGLGGMIIENQVLITPDGHEMMNSLPLDLAVITA